MGLVQSVAQGVVNKVQVRLAKATISHIPEDYQPTATAIIEGYIEINNDDELGAFAATKSTTASLEMPSGGDYGDYAGRFAHFVLPELDIGMGNKSHHFANEIMLTNTSTLMVWFLAALTTPGGMPLNIRADPVVSVAGPDPVSYVLTLDKQLQCTALPEVGVGSDSTGYSDPISITCEYVGPAPAREDEGVCTRAEDCHAAMHDVCKEDGGLTCQLCLAAETEHLTKNGCSTDPLELAADNECYCHGTCGVTSHCLHHMEKICPHRRGPLCDLCITTHMADMLLIGGCGPLRSLSSQACYCYGGNITEDAVV